MKVKLKWQEERVIRDLISDFQEEQGHWGAKEIPDLKIMKKIIRKFDEASKK